MSFQKFISNFQIPILCIGCFSIGAVLEFTMIKWKVGKTNFYQVYKEKESKRIAQRKLISESQKIL